jgi:hypothetical protein
MWCDMIRLDNHDMHNQANSSCCVWAPLPMLMHITKPSLCFSVYHSRTCCTPGTAALSHNADAVGSADASEGTHLLAGHHDFNAPASDGDGSMHGSLM